MSESISRYDVSARDLAKGRNLKIAAWTSPFILTLVPFAITLILLFFFAASPPAAATILFLGLIITVVGFIKGLILSGAFSYKYSRWKDATRERMAADGIKADEIEWFTRELRPAEKRALKDISSRDILLADAYRETVASRLTATRIINSSRKELSQAHRRQTKLRSLNSENSKQFQTQIANDVQKLTSINTDAKQMLIESESRLQMIEAAAIRGGGLADSELALKKLTYRANELPLALEEAKMREEILQEIETDDDLEIKPG
ncbi:MAG: hypothetical protein ACRD6X_13915 [Pyrinomonadaceae bacterium]